MKHIKHLSTSI